MSFPGFSQKKISPKSFPGFSRSVCSDHFQKRMSFPGVSRFLSVQAYPQFSFSFFLVRSFPGFSREILLFLTDFVSLSRYFPSGNETTQSYFPVFPDRFTVTPFENPCRFPIFPKKKILKFFAPICFPVFPDRFTVTPFENPCRFPIFPEQNSEIFCPNLFPDFSRSVYSDPFQKPLSFPVFSRKNF